MRAIQSQQPNSRESLDFQHKNKPNNHKKNTQITKTKFNEVRPECLRPRGNQWRGLYLGRWLQWLFVSLNARGLRVIQFSQHTLKTLESTLGFYTPSTDQQKILRTRLSVDRSGRPTSFFRSTRRSTQQTRDFGSCSRSTCRSTAHASVHVVHVGRPGRSTDPPVFCCCCYFLPLSLCLSSSTSLEIFDDTWQALGMIITSFNIFSSNRHHIKKTRNNCNAIYP